MKTKLTKNRILKSLPTQSRYGVQIDGGKFYRWVKGKREAARIAWCHASAGWPTIVKGEEGQTIWES